MKIIVTPFFFLFHLMVLMAVFSLPAFAAVEDHQNLQLTASFENGSLGGWKQNEKGEIVLQHAAGSGDLWYYFQVDHCLNQTLTFVFEKARADYFGEHNVPVVSYDRQHWSFIKDRIIVPLNENQAVVRFSFTHTFAKNRAWIAYAPPFSNSFLDQITQNIANHSHVNVNNLCASAIHNASIPILSITDPEIQSNEKKGVLLLCREDAYESAGSWLALGVIRFILSDDAVASAIKRRCTFLIVPIFDADGVTMGRVIHPLREGGGDVFWTETWPETTYSFHEQRQMKLFLQQWKDKGNSIDYSFRIHSNSWIENLVRREFTADDQQTNQDKLFVDMMEKKYLPWYRNVDRLKQDTRFSRFVWELFPKAITGFYMSDFIYPDVFGDELLFYKTTDDLMIEGELMVRSLAEHLGIKASDPPPYLHGAEIYRQVGVNQNTFHVRCIYRDLHNRPPTYVRVVINDKPYDLFRVPNQSRDNNHGVIYSGFISLKGPEHQHYFLTTNGSRSHRVPRIGSRPGPFLLNEN